MRSNIWDIILFLELRFDTCKPILKDLLYPEFMDPAPANGTQYQFDDEGDQYDYQGEPA